MNARDSNNPACAISDMSTRYPQSTPHAKNKEQSSGDRYYQHVRVEILNLIPRSTRHFLDVGCGTGGLGAAVKASTGAVAHGIELVPDIAAIASERMDRVWACAVEDALPEVPNGFYDCIVAADVLEHLENPFSTLQNLHKKLSSDGVIVASIPNIQNWEVLSALIEGSFEYASEGILDRTHLRFFTRRSVEELFWNAGLQIEKVGTTIGGPPVPIGLANHIRNSGLKCEALRRDGQTFQFLVRAKAPEKTEPHVMLVVLNWNGRDDTLRCLSSIKNLTYSNYSVVVVDNGSSDNSVSAIGDSFPDLRIIETGKNLGYAGGNNVGIKHALNNGADYILVLNNDTVVESSLLDSLVTASEVLPKPAIIGSAIYYLNDPDVLWYRGGRWDSSKRKLIHEGYGHPLDNKSPTIREVDYVTGCALFAHRSIFEALGGFDESYFLTYEETDFCYRARSIGYRSFVTTRAKLWHSVSASFGGSESPLIRYFMTRNSLLWAKNHLDRNSLRLLRRRILSELTPKLFPSFTYSVKDHRSIKGFWWSLHSWWKEARRAWQDPYTIATGIGLIHHWLRRYGDCPRYVRRLLTAKSTTA